MTPDSAPPPHAQYSTPAKLALLAEALNPYFFLRLLTEEKKKEAFCV